MENRLRNYISDNEFQMRYVNGKLDVVNYEVIDHFDDDKVIFRYGSGIIVVKGDRLIISRMVEDEMLISGKIKSIEIK